MAVSEKKRLANQRNAQKSTGPKTPQGKARSKMNALLHGVFCQEICILKEDRPLFIALRREFIRDLKPQRLIELSIVDKIVESQWKLRRLRVTESVLYEDEMRQRFKREGESFEQEMKTIDDPDYCAVSAMAHMMIREPDNLEKYSRLEQRLQNMVHKCLRELRQLREDRKVIDALPDSPFEVTVEDVKYGWEDGKDNDVYSDEEKSESKVDSAERSQPAVAASPSPEPSPEPSPVKEEAAKVDYPNTLVRNEANEFRNYDADTTCDPSWSASIPPRAFGDPHPGG